MKKLVLAFIFLFPCFLFAQDDLLKMVDDVYQSDKKKDKSYNKVTATFKDPAIINMQTPQTTGDGALNFNISHRFGSMGKASQGGVHTFYGWDAISDVRISFDYGITQKLQIGVGRNNRDEAINGSLKWRFLEQTLDNKIPLSICAYSIASFTPKLKSALYAGADTAWIANEIEKKQVFNDRFSYTSQIIFARKFSKWLSIAITPSYTHRNYVLANINPYNGAEDENDIFSIGAGMRLKLTRSFSILADYFYLNSKYRIKNPSNPYYAPLAIGIELETGGHVFHLDFTNATGITENYFIPNSPDSWMKGGFKLGFNISRAFPLGRNKEGKEKWGANTDNHSETEHSIIVDETKFPVTKNPSDNSIQIQEKKPESESTAGKEIYKVTAENFVNMRSGAGLNFDLIMKINKGSFVEVIEKTNSGWWKIKYMGEIGFVSSKLLSK